MKTTASTEQAYPSGLGSCRKDIRTIEGVYRHARSVVALVVLHALGERSTIAAFNLCTRSLYLISVFLVVEMV